jgi:N-acetylmuramoyl-L-alanine amidase/putative methionine-R-sulfoxide reductase with GAF domain
MSASPDNTSVALLGGGDLAHLTEPPTLRPSFHGYDALQALLAFSSLHEQVRQKRVLAVDQDISRPARSDAWHLEHFVLDEVLQLVADRALAVTGADGIAIALAEDNAIVCRASSGTIAPDAGVRLDPSSGFSGACLRRGEIIRCDDSEHDPRVNVDHCRILGARSMVAVPLSARQRVVGLVEAFSTEAHGFNDSDVRSLTLLAELILAALKPEEENRLAEISRRVVARVDKPKSTHAPETPCEIPPAEPQPIEASALPILGQIPLIPVDSREQRGAQPTEATPETDGAHLLGSPAVAATPEPPAKEEPIPALPQYVDLEGARPGMRGVFALVLLAMLFAGGAWWALQNRGRALSGQPSSAHPQPPTTPQGQLAQPAGGSHSPNDEMDTSVDARKPGAPAEVLGVRHWSSADSSTVAIDLQDQVQYEAHHLANPERIYFDLRDTMLGSAISGKTIQIDDAFLVCVRVAQPESGLTRVVLETKGSPSYSVSLEQNPFRLVVEIRRADAPRPYAVKIDLFAPSSSSPFPIVNKPSTSENGVPKQSSSQSVAALQYAPSELKARAHVPQFRIVLDAGHGGWDLGSVGRKGLLEKDLVLDIVDRLGRLVASKLDAEVIYTRKDDTYLPLEKRAEIANVSHGDLFLSIHANYSDSASARGVETYYTNTYSSVRARTAEASEAGIPLQNVDWTHVDIREKVLESHRFATSVQRALYGTLAAKNPGLRDRGVKEAAYVVLTGTSMPAVLAEVSFVSSPTDETELQSAAYRQQIAEALYRGLAHYTTETQQKAKMASSTTDKPVKKQ